MSSTKALVLVQEQAGMPLDIREHAHASLRIMSRHLQRAYSQQDINHSRQM